MLKLLLALTLLSPAAAFAAAPQPAAPVPAPAAAPVISPEEMQERVKLATEYHDAVPVRDIINRDIENGGAELTADQREEYMRQMQLRVDYDKIEALSIQSMAETFTVPELKAMIAYYGSPEGKSAQDKMDIYSGKIAPLIGQAIDSALMDIQFGGKPLP